MTAKQRPLLVGGAILIFGVWFLETLSHLLGDWSVYAVFLGSFGVIAWWLRQKSERKSLFSQIPQIIDLTAVKRTLSEAESVIAQLATEVENPEEAACVQAKPHVSLLQSQINQVASELNRDEIRLMLMGTKGSGKTSLLQLLQSKWELNSSKHFSFREAPSFLGASTSGLSAEIAAQQQAIAADLVLFLVTGDITESEFQIVKRLVSGKRTMLVFNKQDQYLPEERALILDRLQQRSQGILSAGDIVAISTVPNPLKVRQHQSDGSVKEWLENQEPDISRLTQRLNYILEQESQQLVLTSSYSCAAALKSQAKVVLNDVRRTRAIPVIEQFQWIAAGTAFISPLPSMDLVATVAINAQMIVDLGAIYRQKFSIQQAQKAATSLGSLMLKLGLVELSTRTIASLLKSNALTYVAGGCIQGISAAYLTRVVGLSLIEYFHSQEPNLTLNEANPLAIERLTQILQRVFQHNQQLSFLQTFVNQAFERFSTTQPQLVAAGANPLPELASMSEKTYPSLTPLPTLHPIPQEVEVLEQNRTGMHLSVSSLDSTTLPS